MSMNVNPGAPSRWATLSGDPVRRLSMQTTSHFLAMKKSHRWEPMKPAPPVMITLRFLDTGFSPSEVAKGPEQSRNPPSDCQASLSIATGSARSSRLVDASRARPSVPPALARARALGSRDR